jgi:hypothetical protein
MPAPGHSRNACHIAKRIHREDPMHILGYQLHMAVAAAHRHFP